MPPWMSSLEILPKHGQLPVWTGWLVPCIRKALHLCIHFKVFKVVSTYMHVYRYGYGNPHVLPITTKEPSGRNIPQVEIPYCGGRRDLHRMIRGLVGLSAWKRWV